MNPIYRGIFWVICGYDADDRPILDVFTLLTFKVPCTLNGDILDNAIQLNSKSGTSFNHKLQWNQLPKKTTLGHSYQYYPRGRIEIKRGKAVIFINPVLDKSAVIGKIFLEFGLQEESISSIAIKCDGSSHYHCHCDDPSIH